MRLESVNIEAAPGLSASAFLPARWRSGGARYSRSPTWMSDAFAVPAASSITALARADMAIRQGRTRDDANRSSVTIDEDDVDREPHHDRMHGVARRQQQTFGRPNAVAPKQPSAPGRPGYGDIDIERHRRAGAIVHEGVRQGLEDPGTRCQLTRRQYDAYAASRLSTRSSINARTMNVPSPIRITAAFHIVGCARKKATWLIR